MNKKLITAMMLALTVLATGCNTMHGMGRDIERGGEKIQQEAK